MTDQTDSRLAEAVTRLQAKLKAEADRHYCRYIDDATRKGLLLGAEAKLKAGTFTLANLHAFQEHSHLYGKHAALQQAVNALEDVLALLHRPHPSEEKEHD